MNSELKLICHTGTGDFSRHSEMLPRSVRKLTLAVLVTDSEGEACQFFNALQF